MAKWYYRNNDYVLILLKRYRIENLKQTENIHEDEKTVSQNNR